MSQIEPNLHALLLFMPLWSLCCFVFLQLAGMYPIGGHQDQSPPGSAALILCSTAVWFALVIGTVRFAYVELCWTTSVVVGGIALLFVPGAFQAFPSRWHHSNVGLVAVCCVQVVALGLLATIGATAIGLRAL